MYMHNNVCVSIYIYTEIYKNIDALTNMLRIIRLEPTDFMIFSQMF